MNAILSKYNDNSWIKNRFWTTIHIKVDIEVKEWESDIDKLLQLNDQTTLLVLETRLQSRYSNEDESAIMKFVVKII